MENKSNKKLNPYELESLRSELIEKTINTSSNNLTLSLYQNYFEKILSTDNSNFIEAFLKEFIDDYIHSISKFEVYGTNPNLTEKIIAQLKNLSLLPIASEKLTTLNSEIERIEKQYDKLCQILNGEDYEASSEHKAYFPLIERSSSDVIFGGIDSVTVRINKSTDNNKFIIIPSERELETRIIDQIHTSWQLALELSKKYLRKPNKYHEVIINFDKRLGFYEGNSLGTALTLSFLEQLLKFYNPVYIININDNTAFTGGVDINGKILTTGEEIIQQKVKVLFFSEIKNFVFPKCEESYAFFALTQLQKDYPSRKLKLIPVEDFSDVINRRDLVDVKKQKALVRTSKFVRKNWISAAAVILLAVLFAYFFTLDLDYNPDYADSDGHHLNIRNKNGKILWSKIYNIPAVANHEGDMLKKLCLLIDINNDGLNEVLLANERNNNLNEMSIQFYVKCFSHDGKQLWQYALSKTVTSSKEELEGYYQLNIIDTALVNNKKVLYVFANSSSSFNSAVFSIDLLTGRENKGMLWCSGHTSDALIKDVNDDGIKDLLCIGLDNGFEDFVVFAFTPNEKNSIRPSNSLYKINNLPEADFITLIRIPKNDYDTFYQNRFQSIHQGSLTFLTDSKEYYFILDSDLGPPVAGIWYKLKSNLVDFDIAVDNQFRVKRDSLVAKGFLNKPYTDTREYLDILKSKILYWKKRNWVKREEL